MPQNTAELVSQFEVVQAIGEFYGLKDSHMDAPAIAERVFELESRVERARREGRLTRYVRKDPKTSVVLGYGYKREDLHRFLRTQPGFRRSTATVPA